MTAQRVSDVARRRAAALVLVAVTLVGSSCGGSGAKRTGNAASASQGSGGKSSGAHGGFDAGKSGATPDGASGANPSGYGAGPGGGTDRGVTGGPGMLDDPTAFPGGPAGSFLVGGAQGTSGGDGAGPNAPGASGAVNPAGSGQPEPGTASSAGPTTMVPGGSGTGGTGGGGTPAGSGPVTGGPTDPGSPSPAPPGPEFAVVANNQTGDGSTVTIDRAVFGGSGGFVVIHADEGGYSGVRGASGYLGAGTHDHVIVTLSPPAHSGTVLLAMLHVDDNANQSFDFPVADGPVFYQQKHVETYFRLDIR